MFKNFMWKYFPPKPVDDLELEFARNEFENARRQVLKGSYNNFGSYSHDIFVNATKKYHRLMDKKKLYENYIEHKV